MMRIVPARLIAPSMLRIIPESWPLAEELRDCEWPTAGRITSPSSGGVEALRATAEQYPAGIGIVFYVS